LIIDKKKGSEWTRKVNIVKVVARASCRQTWHFVIVARLLTNQSSYRSKIAPPIREPAGIGQSSQFFHKKATNLTHFTRNKLNKPNQHRSCQNHRFRAIHRPSPSKIDRVKKNKTHENNATSIRHRTFRVNLFLLIRNPYQSHFDR
jgi:hypothetical protein